MYESQMIRIKKSTKERLDAIGKFGESYDVLLNRIIDEFENKRINQMIK